MMENPTLYWNIVFENMCTFVGQIYDLDLYNSNLRSVGYETIY